MDRCQTKGKNEFIQSPLRLEKVEPHMEYRITTNKTTTTHEPLPNNQSDNKTKR